jgi:hypothetical protein
MLHGINDLRFEEVRKVRRLRQLPVQSTPSLATAPLFKKSEWQADKSAYGLCLAGAAAARVAAAWQRPSGHQGHGHLPH